MVPVDSRRVSRAPRYSGTRVRVRLAFTYVAITPYGRLFQVVRLAAGLVTLWLFTHTRPPTPNPPRNSDKWRMSSAKQKPLLGTHHLSLVTALRKAGFGLLRVRSPLLAESLLLSFPPGTEMVHFPGLARAHLWIQWAVPDVDIGRVSPFGHPRIKRCFPFPEAFRR